MRIAIDARAWNWAGIGRYTRNLVAELEKLDTNHDFILLLGEEAKKQYHGKFETHIVDDSHYSWAEQTSFVWQLISVKADLFHFTHFNVPLLFNRPYTVTIHDITRFIFPGQTSQSLFKQLAYEVIFAQAVKRSKQVITVSLKTAQDLKTLPLKPAPITLIYEGVDDNFKKKVTAIDRSKIRARLGINEDYLLFIGVWMGHKNLERLLSAFAEVRERYPRLKLVMTGQPKPRYDNMLNKAKKLGLLEHIVFAGIVPDNLMSALYSESKALVFPSLYEGFGLPALEAATVGTPVVTSNVASLPEIMGEAAIYANPESETDIANAIISLLADPEKRNEVISRGKQQVERYSWEKLAKEHVAVWEATR